MAGKTTYLKQVGGVLPHRGVLLGNSGVEAACLPSRVTQVQMGSGSNHFICTCEINTGRPLLPPAHPPPCLPSPRLP